MRLADPSAGNVWMVVVTGKRKLLIHKYTDTFGLGP